MDWGHSRRQLICKSNEVPEIESYGADLQVSGPADMPASPLLPVEVILKKVPCRCFIAVRRQSSFTICIFNVPRPTYESFIQDRGGDGRLSV